MIIGWILAVLRININQGGRFFKLSHNFLVFHDVTLVQNSCKRVHYDARVTFKSSFIPDPIRAFHIYHMPQVYVH